MGKGYGMQGKTCVITGATSGIGLVAAFRLAAMGAKLVLVGRDRARGEATLTDLRTAVPGSELTMHYADLLQIAEMKRVAGEIAGAHARIDVLINCAGALFAKRDLTADGLERTFALNHLSYFVLANLLLERLRATAASQSDGARIVNVSSAAHRRERLDFSDLQSEKNYRGFRVYSRSKLANILFTRELARRIAGTGITVNALHPGFVATRFGANNRGSWGGVISALMMFAITPEEGADTIVYLASSPEVAMVNGEYFYKRRIDTPDPPARDDDAARLLWTESARLTGVGA